VSNAIQSADSLLGIKLIARAFAALMFFLGVGCLFLYSVDTKTNIQMTRELAERRKEYPS
jgi:Na+/melibiose symporter-like transporter